MPSRYPSRWPAATSHSASAAEPSARNWRHPSGTGGQPDERDHRARRSRSSRTARAASPVELGALAPHRGVARAGGAVLRPARTSGPSASSAHSEIAQYGMPRAQLVDPSTGIEHDGHSASTGPVQPDSSLSTRRPAACSTGSTAASATRSRRYWPGRSVRARRSVGPSVASAPRCAVGGDVEHGEEIVGRHRGAASTVTTAL